MKLNLIGISGKAGSGKDTLATTVFVPRGYQHFAFAWPLKMAALTQGFSYSDVFHEKPVAARQWLQEYGSRKRAVSPDFWVQMTDGWMRTLHASTGQEAFVISDVRYPNECEYIRSMGGKLIRMEHGLGMEYHLAGTAQAEHESERALDEWADWDARIVNTIHGHPALHLTLACSKAALITDYGKVYG